MTELKALVAVVVAATAALCAGAACAQTVSMGGSLGNNALLLIDGKPRNVAVGATVEGVRLVSVSGNDAVVEVKGKRLTLRLGDAQVNLGGRMSDGVASFLAYALYQDSPRTTVWGNTAGTGLVHAGDGASHAITVYGTVAAGQNVPVGSYSDTVVATITF